VGAARGGDRARLSVGPETVTGSARRVELAVVALCAVAGVVFWLVAPTYPNYDAYYHLVCGRDLFDGLKPNFEAYAAPTQHPLEIVAGGILGLIFGVDADRAVVLIAVLSLVLTAWAVFRLGLRVLGLWPALAGTFFAASSFSLLLLAARGYRDVPFLALVFWAAVRAVEGKSDRSVMALLTVAGLLRPEAWVLAGLYALWRRSPSLVAAAAIAPVLWVLTDLWVTGDPLWSLTGTSDLAADRGRSPSSSSTRSGRRSRRRRSRGSCSRCASSGGGGSSCRWRCSAPAS
jgi:type IV secretory pathway VirB2 component (pilin)